METRPHIQTTRSGAATTTAVVASVAVAAPAAKADGLMTRLTLPRIAGSGNGDVDALVARRMR